MRIFLFICAPILIGCGGDPSETTTEGAGSAESPAVQESQADGPQDFLENGAEAPARTGVAAQPAEAEDAERIDPALKLDFPPAVGPDAAEIEFQLRRAIAAGRALWALELYRARGEISRAAAEGALFGADLSDLPSDADFSGVSPVVAAAEKFQSRLVARAPTLEIEAAYIELSLENSGGEPQAGAARALMLAAALLDLAAERYRRGGEDLVAYGDSFGIGLAALEILVTAQADGEFAAQSLEDALNLLLSLRSLWPDIIAPDAPAEFWEAGAAELDRAAEMIGADAEAVENAE
ncbi:MAG: hypothetical protein Tsb0010_03780 [Parvularculaceae bacterium]